MMSAEEVAQRIIRGIERRKRTLLMEFDGRATSLIGKFGTPACSTAYFTTIWPKSPILRSNNKRRAVPSLFDRPMDMGAIHSALRKAF